MGAAQGKQQIKDYLGKHKGGLTQSQDTRHVNRIFKIYDTKKVGYLEFAQAEKFIDDVLSASGIKDQLTQQAGGDENFYPAQVKAMFAELDANGDGKIEVDDILKPGMSGIHTLLDQVKTKITEMANERGDSIPSGNSSADLDIPSKASSPPTSPRKKHKAMPALDSPYHQ